MIKFGKNTTGEYDKEYPIKMNMGCFVPILILAVIGMVALAQMIS